MSATTLAPAAAPMIELRGISRRFEKKLDFAGRIAKRLGAPVREEIVHAVDGVDLSIAKGEVVGLVGESGCGKSTLGRMVAGILPPSDGTVLRQGRDITVLNTQDAREAKLRTQMIFQDPYASLNPRMRVADIVGEAPHVHGIVSGRDWNDYVDEQLRRAGLDPALKRRYPHQFSGGQRQRIGIARALAVKPDFLVCDEAVAALDVSIQAQILNLFMKLRRELDLTYLFISHDLGVVEHLSDRVVIMYLGRVVESAPAAEVFARANHPYTVSLLSAVPRIDSRKRAFSVVQGEIPSPLNPPPGCHFHPRCPHAMPRCKVERPALREIAPGHISACHLNDAS
ncbi:ABC transporter ATP-binding protein [Plastoroseomonas hellenica]|uniref:ABC transporter ATP-binding protein n=1 Tax=Plastoroseomonas hellenica TaxID=2687306 RepID=A0ABS5EW82_9PROT|nr:ABC transporter ATP-binding protein [Plastoroseomonas hellenica]MBR0645790.1 ABC transporter ATP-binding protein [Plastoroseomonas hellenica]MBR0664557.1 ABC transporter ATP-binding protein [Plastoroseomonas hellenica]